MNGDTASLGYRYIVRQPGVRGGEATIAAKFTVASLAKSRSKARNTHLLLLGLIGASDRAKAASGGRKDAAK